MTRGVDRGADGLCLGLHQVDVFGAAQRLLEQQLVDGRAAAKGDPAGERWRIEQVAERAADDQVLLDLRRAERVSESAIDGPACDAARLVNEALALLGQAADAPASKPATHLEILGV